MDSNDWTFVTFGAGSFSMRQAAKRLCKQATASGYFNRGYAYTEKVIQSRFPEYFETNEAFFLDNPRGYGRWKWKPFLLLQVLATLEPDAGVLYLDAGCQFNFSNEYARNHFKDLLTEAQECGGLFTQLSSSADDSFLYAEEKWTSQAVLDLFHLSEEQLTEGQVQGGILFLINNCRTKKLLEKWLELCEFDNSKLLSDHPYSGQERDDFQLHRHDQSIFSCLVKANNFHRIPDETYWGPNWKIDGKNYPVWALRNKTGVTLFKPKFEELPEWAYWMVIRIFRKIGKLVNRVITFLRNRAH